MIRKIIASLMIFLAFSAVVSAAPRAYSQLEVTWAPNQPEPGERITVTVSSEETNVSGIHLQVCVKTKDNYVCRIPEQMQELNGDYVHSFYINDTAEVFLNFTIRYLDGFKAYDNSSSFDVKTAAGDNGGTPGFGFVLAVTAAGLAAVFARKQRKKF
jgi:PGF-CTERM protein